MESCARHTTVIPVLRGRGGSTEILRQAGLHSKYLACVIREWEVRKSPSTTSSCLINTLVIFVRQTFPVHPLAGKSWVGAHSNHKPHLSNCCALDRSCSARAISNITALTSKSLMFTDSHKQMSSLCLTKLKTAIKIF